MLRVFLLVFFQAGAAQAGGEASGALVVLGRSISAAASLHGLLGQVSSRLGWPGDSAAVYAQALMGEAQRGLGRERVQRLVRSRWAAAEETQGLDGKQGLVFLRALLKEARKLLRKPGDYRLKLVVGRAAKKAKLPSWQALAVLKVALGPLEAGQTAARAPADTLFLSVISEELLAHVPGILEKGKWRTYSKYVYVLR